MNGFPVVLVLLGEPRQEHEGLTERLDHWFIEISLMSDFVLGVFVKHLKTFHFDKWQKCGKFSS